MATSTQAQSEWQRAGTVPVRNGVYRTNSGFQYWNGEFWGVFRDSVSSALQHSHYESMFQTPRWREITQNPEAA